jgi:hypothetical protein
MSKYVMMLRTYARVLRVWAYGYSTQICRNISTLEGKYERRKLDQIKNLVWLEDAW